MGAASVFGLNSAQLVSRTSAASAFSKGTNRIAHFLSFDGVLEMPLSFDGVLEKVFEVADLVKYRQPFALLHSYCPALSCQSLVCLLYVMFVCGCILQNISWVLIGRVVVR